MLSWLSGEVSRPAGRGVAARISRRNLGKKRGGLRRETGLGPAIDRFFRFDGLVKKRLLEKNV